jgi:NAD(P)-dependent dehydrogenase (short-subunit alcohol dehydrogenase family)
MAPLTNKRVIIIGASAGLGFGVAKAALGEGAHVIICSSNKTRLEAAARELGGGDKLSTDVVDLTSEDSIKAFFDKSGKFEHLVITVSIIYVLHIPDC